MNAAGGIPLDRIALGRLLTRVANADSVAALGGLLAAPVHCARRIGITGSPGVGKSTLVRCLAATRLAAGRRVGVLAVDPSSPYTKGAILGDRIRLGDLSDHPELFFRSLASRSAHDGLADNLPDLLCAMEQHRFDDLFVETVGVGQAELGVRALVDCVALVVMPGTGDQVQAMKAGILEIADVLIVNKADLPGARQLAAELKSVIALGRHDRGGWVPPVLPASEREVASHGAIMQAIDTHCAWQDAHQDALLRSRNRAAYHARSLLNRRLEELLAELPPATFDRPLAEIQRALLRLLAVDLGSSRSAPDHSG